MATKRLSRTIVEGGRRGGDKYARKLQIQKSRRAARDFCRIYKEDDIETLSSNTGRHYYYREFNDRLSPLKNYLRAHIGVHWDIIWSKLCAIRSRNTIQGWHFLDHAKSYVFSSTGPNKSYWGFYLEDGILREQPRKKHRWRYDKKLLERYQNWIGEDRHVRKVGSVYFWYDAVMVFRYDERYGTTPYKVALRQGVPLNRKEIGHMEWLKAKDDWIWNKILGN